MTATFDQARHVLKVMAEKNLTQRQQAGLHDSGLLTDLLEAAKQGSLDAVDRTVYRHVLGLSPHESGTVEGVLKFIDTIEVTLPFDLNPADFYKDKKGFLYVYGGFVGGDLVKQAEPLPAGTKFRVNVHEIVAEDGATDAEIEAALGGDHLFDPTTVCGFFAAMMSAQPNGEDGHLLNNGYANLAYTSSSVAHVGRALGDREWRVGAWPRGGRGWRRGYRVFSPATCRSVA